MSVPKKDVKQWVRGWYAAVYLFVSIIGSVVAGIFGGLLNILLFAQIGVFLLVQFVIFYVTLAIKEDFFNGDKP